MFTPHTERHAIGGVADEIGVQQRIQCVAIAGRQRRDGYVGAERALFQDEARAACTTRSESRADVRAAIAVAIDEGAKELGAADAERAALGKRVDTAVLKQLPPPDC